MLTVEAKLRRLLNWPVVYFIVESVVADVLAARILATLPESVPGGCWPGW